MPGSEHVSHQAELRAWASIQVLRGDWREDTLDKPPVPGAAGCIRIYHLVASQAGDWEALSASLLMQGRDHHPETPSTLHVQSAHTQYVKQSSPCPQLQGRAHSRRVRPCPWIRAPQTALGEHPENEEDWESASVLHRHPPTPSAH